MCAKKLNDTDIMNLLIDTWFKTRSTNWQIYVLMKVVYH